jgi:hypothetical protein
MLYDASPIIVRKRIESKRSNHGKFPAQMTKPNAAIDHKGLKSAVQPAPSPESDATAITNTVAGAIHHPSSGLRMRISAATIPSMNSGKNAASRLMEPVARIANEAAAIGMNEAGPLPWTFSA